MTRRWQKRNTKRHCTASHCLAWLGLPDEISISGRGRGLKFFMTIDCIDYHSSSYSWYQVISNTCTIGPRPHVRAQGYSRCRGCSCATHPLRRYRHTRSGSATGDSPNTQQERQHMYWQQSRQHRAGSHFSFLVIIFIAKSLLCIA